jgi:hypothetical protein
MGMGMGWVPSFSEFYGYGYGLNTQFFRVLWV